MKNQSHLRIPQKSAICRRHCHHEWKCFWTPLTAYNATSGKFVLIINAKKTEVMCIGPECEFFVDDVKLKNVERFKYLESYVNRACNLKAEITARI